jgi:hypothetical protein
MVHASGLEQVVLGPQALVKTDDKPSATYIRKSRRHRFCLYDYRKSGKEIKFQLIMQKYRILKKGFS